MAQLFRITARGAALLVTLGWAAFLHGYQVCRQPSLGSVSTRSEWLHKICQRLIKVLGVQLHVRGPVPRQGLLVSNHLGYLDILVLAATTPCLFVSKSEVETWPLFGWFARRAGTLFVQRGKRSDTARASSLMTAALHQGALVVLFPEGTSTNGFSVLPFKSALLQPAIEPGRMLTVCSLEYHVSGGNAATDVCYWGEMTLVPHLLRLLGLREIRARITYAPWEPELSQKSLHRKDLARTLHSEVVRLHAMGQRQAAELPSHSLACHAVS